MTIYNGAEFMEKAIDSVLNQTYRNIELIILNDGSTDATEAIALEKQRQDHRINYFINEENLGLSQSRNKAMKLAQGDLIAITDADDINVPHRFELQVSQLLKHPEVDIIGSSVTLVNNKNEICDVWYYPLEHNEIKEGLETASTVANPSCMFKREVFSRLGGYTAELIICEDWDFFYRAGSYFRFANISEPLVFYRFHENNTSVTKLEYTVMYATCFRLALHEKWYRSGVKEFAEAHPEYISQLCYNINRFYAFSMNTFLKLKYPRLSNQLYLEVQGRFFPFFNRPAKKLFIKNAIVVCLRNKNFKRLPSLIKDFLRA